jgi:hypothetical protein
MALSLSAPESEPSNAHEDDENPEQEFEFRLFSSAAPAQPGEEKKGTTQKIILVDKEGDFGDGGFVMRERNRGYYFAGKADGKRRLDFQVMALSGEEVLSRARSRAWGLEVPWRVQVLKVAGKKIGRTCDSAVAVEDDAGGGMKKKPGKKRRIILRQRKKTRDMLQEQMKAAKDKKEEAEREKKTRRNREKKVKRKMKEKAKKAGDGVEDGGNGMAVPEPPPE